MSTNFYRISILFVLVSGQLFGQGQSDSSFTLYLIGDAGEPTVKDVSYKKTLRQQLQENKDHAVVFLGDNVYPKGMPALGAPSRPRAESILQSQIMLAGDGQSPVYFIPGNHDWKRGRKEGWGYITNQQQWFDSLENSNVHFLPEGGCPGPEEVSLSGNLTLVILDTQWPLHPWDKPEGPESPCGAKSVADVITQLDDILHRNKGKRVVIVGHHPIFTYGEHGGVFTLKEHLFPLTDIQKNLWVPLPGIGSVYPLYRKIIGNIQDTSHPVYKEFTSAMTRLLKQYPETVYASGHEHTLQYCWKDNVHYVVSGAGSKATFVRKKGNARFVYSGVGYARIRVKHDGAATLEYFNGTELLFSQELLPPANPSMTSSGSAQIFKGKTGAIASKRYGASRAHEKWLGKNYRAEWQQEIQAPVFDIGTEHGGLKIIQRGGGQQTLSLRLQDSSKREFTLRSIEKFPAKAIPEPFRNTFAEDLVQDQISASHPYGAIVIPPLARAAGIYHTNPEIVFIPDDPRFGIYQRDFSNQLMLFEERPSGDGKGMDFFGNADKIIGVDKLLEKLTKDNDNHVDEEFVLRNRIFDLWIGDWDRHDDQWRWAESDEKKGKRYRPIPRDRDQAFFVNEGRLPPLWSKRWLLPKFEGFKDGVAWPGGLMYNGRYFDRSFLTELTRAQWIKTAESISAAMTDSVIDSALKRWPEEIYKIHGTEIKQKLQARREKLVDYAVSYYLFLAREVSVVGSDKAELFEVTRMTNGNVLVQVFKLTKENDAGKKIYEREFINEETKEVILYGLGGADRFILKGKGKNGIKVRIIGGSGKDEVEAGPDAKETLVYDGKGDVSITGKGKVRDLSSFNPAINEYDRKAYVYERYAPLLYGNYNIDDGVFIGGGTLITTQGFRKKPFKNKHLLLASFAVNTRSFNFKYDGRFTQLIGRWNLEVDVDVKSPNYVNNFFGLGNESVFDQHIKDQPGVNVGNSIQYYRMRFKEYDFEAKIARPFGQTGFIKVGPAFQRVGIEDAAGKSRYIKEYAATLPEPLLEVGRNFGGATYSWGFDKRNSPVITTRGIFFQQTSRWMAGLSAGANNFSAHQVSLAFYETFRFPAKITFAFRASAGKTFGDYQIYQAQILDGRTEIRGFRKTRFYGDSKLVFNNEVRIKLASFRSYLFPASFGVTGFYDVGRVWYKDKTGVDPTSSDGKSSVWHNGVGGGLWFTPFNLTVLAVEMAHSNEENLGYVRLGFLF
jgi:predicted phosphodiesterase